MKFDLNDPAPHQSLHLEMGQFKSESHLLLLLRDEFLDAWELQFDYQLQEVGSHQYLNPMWEVCKNQIQY